MSDIKVGDLVECVEDCTTEDDTIIIKNGSVHMVSEVFQADASFNHKNKIGIRIEGIHPYYYDGILYTGSLPECFRPIRDQKAVKQIEFSVQKKRVKS